MVLKNRFYIKELRQIVFIGFSPVFSDLLETNRKNNIQSQILSSTDQSKRIFLAHKIFDKIDKNLYDFISDNYKIDKTLFISLGSRLIFDKKFISFTKGNLINFHGARLPYDSGGGGFSWRIMREDKIDNQLVHLIDSGIDTGPVITHNSSIYPKWCKIPIDYEEHSTKLFLKFYEDFIKKIKNGKSFQLKHQMDYIGRYNPRLSSVENSFIDWNFQPRELYSFINSFDEPYIGATTFLNNGNCEKVHLKNVHLHGGDSSNHPFMTGLISRHDKKWIVVSTGGKYSLLVEKVLNEKGENILHKIKAGDRFYTPQEYLDNSFSKRVVYNALGKKQ